MAEDDASVAKKDRIQIMRQEFTELRQAIASDLDARFQASEQRIREGLSEGLDTKFEVSELRIREGLSKEMAERFAAGDQRVLDGLTQVVVRQLDTAHQQLDDRLQIHAEALKDVVTKAAEGYGGTLSR